MIEINQQHETKVTSINIYKKNKQYPLKLNFKLFTRNYSCLLKFKFIKTACFSQNLSTFKALKLHLQITRKFVLVIVSMNFWKIQSFVQMV